MTNTYPVYTGGCMCGTVRYEISGLAVSVSYCHCSSCRRHTGAPVVAMAVFKPEQVRFTGGERNIYNSSPGVHRAFCGACGTSLTWEGIGGDLGPIIDIHISTLDDPDQLIPELHFHHGERIKWFDSYDSLPRFRGWAEGNEPYRHSPVDQPFGREQ